MLGEPGAGKTMLLIGLVLDLLHPSRCDDGKPIPVLASLASWDPISQDLHGWLGDTLITGYPDLAGAPPPGFAANTRFEALLEAGLILPILDGLDEVPESARPAAITRINKELRPGEQVVVACRTEQYQATVSRRDGQGAVLRAAAVQLSTLPFGEVASYLRRNAGPGAKGRWDFLDALNPESPVRQALTTPLMAGLTRAIYNPRPGELIGELRHPAELCDLADRPAIEAHLFDAFIHAAYRYDPVSRWNAQDAERWLVFLAGHLEHRIGGPDFNWWQLREAMPTLVMLRVGNVLTFAWKATGILGNLREENVLRFGARAPARGIRISAKDFARGVGWALTAAGVAALTTLLSGGGFGAGLALGLTIALVGGLTLGPGAGLVGAPDNLAGITSPRAVLTRDRRVALLLVLVVGLGFGFGVGLLAGLLARHVAGGMVGLVVGLVVWLLAGLAAGFGLSMSQAAWPAYMLARGWLALHHRLPWSLMNFSPMPIDEES